MTAQSIDHLSSGRAACKPCSRCLTKRFKPRVLQLAAIEERCCRERTQGRRARARVTGECSREMCALVASRLRGSCRCRSQRRRTKDAACVRRNEKRRLRGVCNLVALQGLAHTSAGRGFASTRNPSSPGENSRRAVFLKRTNEKRRLRGVCNLVALQGLEPRTCGL